MIGKRLVQANQIAKRVAKREYWLRDYENKYFGILRKTRKTCSCWMCRNLRENEGMTIQERRQILGDKLEE